MPLPIRQSGESESDFIGRCIPVMVREGKDQDQASTICYSQLEGNTMTLRVNIRSRVVNSAIRRETRNGREVIVVPSATLPDNVVMNQIKYPADVIAKSYQTIDNTPAPLGHPMVNGKFISAQSPEGINLGWIGAHNTNVRRENGRVFVDKVIDVEVAKRHPRGEDLLAAINEQKPIHTSTGVMLETMPEKGEGYDRIATNMVFDHDAILLDEPGAATPEQGVGIYVNSQGEEVDALNVDLPSEFLEQVAEEIMWKQEREQREQKKRGIMEALLDWINGIKTDDRADNGLIANRNEDDTMPVSEKDFAELNGKVDQLVANSGADAVAEALKPLLTPITDRLTALEANAKKAEEAERQGYVDQIVKANLLDEDTAKALDVNAAKALAAKCKPAGPAAGAIGGFQANNEEEDPWKGVDLNANLDKAAKGGE